MSARLERKVRAALTDDLRKPEYRGHECPTAGHCYVASEAMYHLLGGKAAGYTPEQVNHEGSSHWYLRGPKGEVIDPTADQFKSPPPYDQGRGRGFLTREPSKRAKTVIERVK